MTWSSGPRITAVHLPPSRTSISISSIAILYVGPPYQSAKRSGSVHSRQTSLRGASKVQFISMSGLSATEASLHSLESALPEAPVAVDPLGGFPEGIAVDAGGPELCRAAARDQAGALEDLEVLGDGLHADRERLGELAHRRLAGCQPLQDRPPGGIGEGGEGPVELIGGHGAVLNQMVE